MNIIKYILSVLCLSIAIIACNSEEAKGIPATDIQNLTVQSASGMITLNWEYVGEEDENTTRLVEIRYYDPATKKNIKKTVSKFSNSFTIDNALEKHGEYTFEVQPFSTTFTPGITQRIVGTAGQKARKVVIGYLPLDDWEFDSQFPTIEWKHLTHINASFVWINADGTLNTSAARKRLESVRETAHMHNVKVLISLAKSKAGAFTAAINDPKVREGLITQIIAFTKEYKLDGFDIDYEEYDNWDKNFPSLLAFAKGLHQAKEENMLMTCAVNSRWLNYGTEWEQYFDYINLMSYDRGAFTNKPVQHASYDDFVKDLKYWNEQCRASKSKIVGGLPFYGYSWEESLQGAVDAVRAIRYCGILGALGDEAANKDNIGKTYYNGQPTIVEKCKFVKENDYAGVMIWQLFQDAHKNKSDLKLINTIGEVMKD